MQNDRRLPVAQAMDHTIRQSLPGRDMCNSQPQRRSLARVSVQGDLQRFSGCRLQAGIRHAQNVRHICMHDSRMHQQAGNTGCGVIQTVKPADGGREHVAVPSGA